MQKLTLAALFAAFPAFAADHAEAPGTQADSAADIADLFAWYAGDDVTVALTFAGLGPAGGSATYDADVLYQIHFDSDADNLADGSIDMRFGESDDGAWGVQATMPDGTIVHGAVGETIVSGDISVYAGLRDDPFFFDLGGFRTTLSTGTLSFDSTRDALAGTNVTSLVVEFPRASVDGGGDLISIWATTSRI
ncbi:MAG: hypothetical protein ACJA00_004189 [Myxococcota bacterium]|jgi:hypothetical protein